MKLFRLVLAALFFASVHPASAAPVTLMRTLENPGANTQRVVHQGWSVALEGNLAVVGAPRSDTSGVDSGLVKIFNATSGALLYVLPNPDPEEGDLFGKAVAISGQWVVVGESGDNAVDRRAGEVHVFNLTSPAPAIPVFTLPNPVFGADSIFGYSVAVSGSRVVVGAPYHLYEDVDVTDGGIAYVYDLAGPTPTNPIVTLRNPSPGRDDRFGWSVAISGNRVVVGAVLKDVGAEDVGAAYVFELGSASPATPVLTLTNPVPAVHEQFGFAVGLSGDRLVVGARYDNGERGSAYVYNLAGPTPTVPVTTLANPGSGGNFGFAVSVSGDRAVIGAIANHSGAPASGIAYVYDLSNPAFKSPLHILSNPQPDAGDFFGFSAAISGTRVLVGAPNDGTLGVEVGSAYSYDLTSATPTVPVVTLSSPDLAAGELFGYSVSISGPQIAVGAPSAGMVHVYDASGALPVLSLSNPGARDDGFGFAVAISSTRALVGAPGANRAYLYPLAAAGPILLPIILPNPRSPAADGFGQEVAMSDSRIAIGASHSGRVYLYDPASLAPPVPVLTLTNANPDREDRFGAAIAMSGSRLVVGAPWDDTGAINAGSAYVYDLAGPSPSVPVAVLRNPEPNTEDYFGSAVAISGSRVVVGARQDSMTVGGAGGAYVFDLAGLAPAQPVLTLPNPEPALYDWFGGSVAISGTVIVIGAYGDDARGTNSGSVFVYDLGSPTPARPIATLNGSFPKPGDGFGNAVGIDGAVIVAGSPFSDIRAADRGVAYLFGVVPELRISRASPGSAVVSWTPSLPGFVLQSSDTLPGQWTNVPDAAGSPVTVATTNATRFYRLKRP